MGKVTLREIAAEKPFLDYQDWWPMGESFLNFMSKAIVENWEKLAGNSGKLRPVVEHVDAYLVLVYGRESRPGLVRDFASRKPLQLQSGEFDALSYGFYRHPFELIARFFHPDEATTARERRFFTKRVGTTFFDLIQEHLQLDLPEGLDTTQAFGQLRAAIDQIGQFLDEENYLRDGFDFRFDLDLEHAGQRIVQTEADLLNNLRENGVGYALYIMGYPVILPSAIYLYNIIGEAQHHSSRIIEELFSRLGYEARETEDFDPTDYPADRVVELWEMSLG
jgi:hypothetical protein